MQVFLICQELSYIRPLSATRNALSKKTTDNAEKENIQKQVMVILEQNIVLVY